jgi:hypothetical protein
MNILKRREARSASAVLAVALCILIFPALAPWGAFAPSDGGYVYAAVFNDHVGTAGELTDSVAEAPDGAVITVTTDITLTGGALKWDDRNITIRGANESIRLIRGAGHDAAPMFEVGGTDVSQTTPAGLILENIIVDDSNNPDGVAYGGVISAFRQGVTITMKSGAAVVNSGAGSSVYLSGSAPSGPGSLFIMHEGSRIMDANGSYLNGAGVFVGTGAAFTMEGGVIQANRTAGDGGGVYVAGGAKFIMKNGLVKGNDAVAGGGVMVSGAGAGGAFIMEGGSVTGNTVSGMNTTKNYQGWDVAVEAPSGPARVFTGTPPGYADSAFSARIYPGAVIGSGKVGIQNKVADGYAPPSSGNKAFNQAVYIPSDVGASVCAGALNQYGSAADTAVLNSLTSAAVTQMPSSNPAFAGLTYAGNIVYSPEDNTGALSIALNYPDEIPAYDASGENIRNRYSYAVAYAPLDSSGALMAPPQVIDASRGPGNLEVEFDAVYGASAYGIAKYYYGKSGALNVTLAGGEGGGLAEKNTGASGSLHFDSVLSGAAFVASPASFTLKAVPEPGWRIGTVTLTAADGYTVRKEVDANGEFELYYTDLAHGAGANTVEVVFVRVDGSIDLSIGDASFVYDGRPHSAAISGIIPGDEVVYMYRVGDSGFVVSAGNPSFTDVNGVVANSVAGGVNGEEILVYAIVTRGAVSVRDSASLTILPRPVTVKPVNERKTYDGSPLKPGRVEISSGTLVAGHVLETSSAVFTGSQTNAGSSASGVSGVSVSGTNPDNYALSYAPGTLTVARAPADKDDGDSGRDKNGGKDRDDEDDDDSGSGGGSGSGSGGGSGGGSGSGGGDQDAGSGGDDDDRDAGPDDEDEGDGETGTADGDPDDGDDTGTINIDNTPTPEGSFEGGGDKGNGGNGFVDWFIGWPLMALVVIAAAFVWALLVWRRRSRGDEDATDEEYKR